MLLFKMKSPISAAEDGKPAAADCYAHQSNNSSDENSDNNDDTPDSVISYFVSTMMKPPPVASLENIGLVDSRAGKRQDATDTTGYMESDEAMARALQASLLVSEGVNRNVASSVDDDEVLAWVLQTKGEHPAYRVREALNFCQRLRGLHEELVARYGSENPAFEQIKPVAQMFAITRLLQAQEAFRCQDKRWDINLGSHHTKQSCMESIRQHGLLTKKERANLGIKSHGKSHIHHGDGIFTLNSLFGHPEESDCDTGLIVARLFGGSEKMPIKRDLVRFHDSEDAQVNEYRAILGLSSQTLPLIEYPLLFASDPSGNYQVAKDNSEARALQIVRKHVHKLVDELLNSRECTNFYSY